MIKIMIIALNLIIIGSCEELGANTTGISLEDRKRLIII
jgi:hypothetical protein